MKKSIFIVLTKDFKKRPFSFLSSFVIALVGMYIIFSMLFMQFGARQADIQRAENQYHIYLEDLTEEHVDKIKKLPYVDSVSATAINDFYTGNIKLKNNDPYELKNYCEKIITDIGLDNTDAYQNNTYYMQYGIPDNWINQEYYSLATSFFLGELLPLLIPFILITVISLYISVKVKLKSEIDEFGTLKTLGLSVNQLMLMISLEYSFLFVFASIFSFIASAITLKLVSVYTYSNFSDSFMRFDDALKIKEAFIIFTISYVIFLIIIQGCRKFLKQNIILMLNKAHEITISYNKRARKKIVAEKGITQYNKLYFKRTFSQLIIDFSKNCILFVLPLFFIAFASSVYGMKDQANTTYDFGIFYNAPHKVTDEVIALIGTNNNIEHIETTYTYEDGSYGGIHIYCFEDKEDETKEFAESVAQKYSLIFTDNYHESIMTINQSSVFSKFYLFQATLLFLSGIVISLADTNFHYIKRTKEISIIKALGLTNQELSKLYLPDFFTKLLSFICSIIFSFAAWIKLFGIPYVKPLYILSTLLTFLVIYCLVHIFLLKHHQNKIAFGILSEKMKEVI